MTLLNELEELIAILREEGIHNRTQLRQRLGLGKAVTAAKAPPETPLEQRSMKELQGILSDLISQIHRDISPATAEDRPNPTMGDTRFWVEKQCNVWRYRYASLDDSLRDDCLKQIYYCRVFLVRQSEKHKSEVKQEEVIV